MLQQLSVNGCCSKQQQGIGQAISNEWEEISLGGKDLKAVLFSQGKVSMINQDIPSLDSSEVLIKTSMVGICNTDVELFNGYYQFTGVPGHEFVGVVVKAPGNPTLEGQRVTADINCGCGNCQWCKNGDPRHCTGRRTIGISNWNGAFAEYVKAPLQNVYPIDDSISDQEAVFTEPLAAALEISQQLHLIRNQKIAVLGDGKIGLLIAMGLRIFNPGILLSGKHQGNLNIAAAQGVDTWLYDKVYHSYQELLEERGQFDIVIEATGNADGINDALNLVRSEGTIVLKTTSHLPSSVNLSRVVVDEIQMMGSRCGDIPFALHYLKNHWVDVNPLVEAVYPFDSFPEAFDHARKPGSRKILLAF